jgi:hypothetical protein
MVFILLPLGNRGANPDWRNVGPAYIGPAGKCLWKERFGAVWQRPNTLISGQWHCMPMKAGLYLAWSVSIGHTIWLNVSVKRLTRQAIYGHV